MLRTQTKEFKINFELSETTVNIDGGVTKKKLK